MSIAMTEKQKEDFETNGFIILDHFFTSDELDQLLSAVDDVGIKVRCAKGLGPDDPFAIRNALAHHDAFLNLIDHPRMLPLVVDAIGWNIQVREPVIWTTAHPTRLISGLVTLAVLKVQTIKLAIATSSGIRTLPEATCSKRLRSTDGYPSWRSKRSTCSLT